MHQYRQRVVSSLTFTEARSADVICQAQILASLALRNGEFADDFDALAVSLEADFGVTEQELVLERVTFTRVGDAEAALEMWRYFGEHGVVCEAGSSTATPVHCVQGHYWSTDPDDAESVALAEALNRV